MVFTGALPVVNVLIDRVKKVEKMVMKREKRKILNSDAFRF